MIFRKDEARDAYQKPFEEADVRSNVERKVEREKRQALMDEWILHLRERAEVKTYIDRIPEAPAEDESEAEEAPDAAQPEE